MKATIVAVLLCVFCASTASAKIKWTNNVKGPRGELPAVPAAKGFGVYTRPAKNARVYKVTNLKEKGRGSLEDCINGKGNRVCVFEVAGRIKYRNILKINNPNIHIAGQTAPHPGIVIQAPQSIIRTSNVVIEHVRFMSSDEITNRNIRDTKGYHNRDALAIESYRPIKNIFLNHVSINFGIDSNLDVWGNINNVSIRNSLIALPLHYSMHVDRSRGSWRDLQPHAMNLLIGHAVGNIDVTRSVLGYAHDRQPRSGAKNLFFSENVVYDSSRNIFVDLYTKRGGNRTVESNVVGNIFISKRSSRQSIVNLWAERNSRINLYASKNNLLLRNGRTVRTPSARQSVIDRKRGGYSRISSRPVKTPHRQSIPRSPVRERTVLDNAGARPAFRIQLERDIVRNIKSRRGELVNCYHERGDHRFDQVLRRYAKYPGKNAPSIRDRCELDRKGWNGWRRWLLSTRIMKRHSLDPRMPSKRDMNRVLPSGYTQLEAFLHACSRKVENNHGDCHRRAIDKRGRGWD